jgi:hypothetical protein
MAITYAWRGDFENAEVNALQAEAFDHRRLEDDWRGQVERHSLGRVCARDGDELVGFVNVPWDGAIHAFILDTIVAASHGRAGNRNPARGNRRRRGARSQLLLLIGSSDPRNRLEIHPVCGRVTAADSRAAPLSPTPRRPGSLQEHEPPQALDVRDHGERDRTGDVESEKDVRAHVDDTELSEGIGDENRERAEELKNCAHGESLLAGSLSSLSGR